MATYRDSLAIHPRTRLWSNKLADYHLEKEKTEEIWNWIVDQSNSLSCHPSLDGIPPLAKIMTQFRDGLSSLRKAIKNFAKVQHFRTSENFHL